MRRIACLICALILVFALSDSSYGQNNGSILVFDKGVRFQVNGSDIQVGEVYSAPHIVDWNEDGKKDLLVGTYYTGNVYLFLNTGTINKPVLTEGKMLEADGQVITFKPS